jgi:hypothetical protein
MNLEQAFIPSQRCPAYGLCGVSAVLASPVRYKYIILISYFWTHFDQNHVISRDFASCLPSEVGKQTFLKVRKSEVCEFLSYASPQIANLQNFMINPQIVNP